MAAPASTALEVIRDEHQALAAMLRTMSMMLAQARREGARPDFDVLRAMLFYVDEYPERLHHRKESELLFPKVRARCPELAGVLDRLDSDHELGESEIRELEHAMLGFELLGEPRRAVFETALDRYIEAYLKHMAVEEHQVMPAARANLTAADWKELDAAFSANRDPLTGHTPDALYEPLFRTILSSLKAPYGLG
jgi:hemerythrin-like domain-containing protein